MSAPTVVVAQQHSGLWYLFVTRGQETLVRGWVSGEAIVGAVGSESLATALVLGLRLLGVRVEIRRLESAPRPVTLREHTEAAIAAARAALESPP